MDAAEVGEAAEPPRHEGLPLLGSTIRLARDPFAFLEELSHKGDIVRYRAGPNRFTVLFHPSDIEQVLVSDHAGFRRWAFTEVGIDLAPEGVFSVDYDRWRRQRQLIQRAFTIDRIGSHADLMCRYAAEMASEWEDGEVLDLSASFRRLTLRILTRALFDLEIDPETDESGLATIVSALNATGGGARNFAMLLPDWIPTPSNRRLDRAIDRYEKRLDELVEARRSDASDRDDLLSVLLTAEDLDGGRLTENEVRDNLLTFMFAGHDTTSLALGYTVLSLATHPDAAAAVRAEIDDHVAGELPTLAELQRMSTLENTIRESLRLYPPIFVMFREAIEDAVIGGYRIPEGSVVTLPQYHVHRDGRFYDDPDTFRPGRWTGSFRESLPEYAYFPFGGGPRHCIGMRFAMLELRAVMATLLADWEFALRSEPEPDPTAGVTLHPTEPVRIRVKRR